MKPPLVIVSHSWVLVFAALGVLAPRVTVKAESVPEVIAAAGNTTDEMERLRLVKTLAARSDLDPNLRSELAGLLPIVDEWADGKSRPMNDTARAAENGYLCRFISGKAQVASAGGPIYPPEPAKDSPLHPLWALYRGRMLIWRVIQSGPLNRVEETRNAWLGEARQLLREARHAFPKNRVIGMYLGEPIPWPHSSAPDPAAPAWANLQREGLEKLAEIIHWWIRERQMPDGQFGGGWGDDVEMWRWWVPALIAFEDPVIIAAQERISNGMFERPHMRAGFTSRLTDVEHSNEDSTDTILPMMHLRPDEAIWQQRALRLTELMRDKWTGRNQRGFLQFKSIYFSASELDESPGRAFDTVYHPAILQPTLLYWQRTADPELTRLFGEWLNVWIDAAARAENGKPAGILPSTIAWPSGSVGTIAAGGTSWWQPFPLDHNDALYNWPGATRLMTSTLLQAWHMTGDEKYLAPLRSMAAFALAHRKAPSDAAPGSAPWIARQMREFLGDTLAKYRLLSGDRQYDELLADGAGGYTRFRISGDRRALEHSLAQNAEAFRSNWEAYTSEMRWTDRVISFTRNYLRHLPEPSPPPPTPDILYACATGDPGTPLVFPLCAVRWRTPPREIAALVTDATPTSFSAELFHFGDAPRKIAAELLLLRPGEYELTVSAVEGAPKASLSQSVFRVTGPRVHVALELPSRRLAIVTVRPLASPR
jgi:hypothetical protein